MDKTIRNIRRIKNGGTNNSNARKKIYKKFDEIMYYEMNNLSKK